MSIQFGRSLAAPAAGLLIISGIAVAPPAGAANGDVRTATTRAATSPVAGSTRAAASEVQRSALLEPSSVPLFLLAADRPSKVTVPARYVYDPKLGARHDYCTMAPDEFPAPHAANADFRGPCARHDLCYDRQADQKYCDKALRRNMFRNCRHYYGKYNPLRTACKVAAVTYWAAVVAT